MIYVNQLIEIFGEKQALTDTFWQDRRVFVTGCTGLLGSWLTDTLIQKGATVIGLIHTNPAQSLLVRLGVLSQIETVHGDICDYDLMVDTLNRYQINTIFHLAAQTLVVVANRQPMATFETNIKGTWTVLEAARHCPTVTRVLVASSDKAYGTQPILPYREDAPLQGQHPYDVSKSCADLIARTYAKSYDLPVAVTRCSNLYGGGDFNWNRLIPGTIRSVLRGERPLVRSDGCAKRNYIFIHDAVRGYLMVAEQMHKPAVHGEAFNFGVDTPTTVLDMIHTIIKVSDSPYLEPIILNEAKNEIQEQNLCSDKARHILKWVPQYTLESSLAETFAWYRTFLATG